jgi:PhnB protein
MVSDAFPDYGAVSPEPGNTTATFALSIYVPDVDATMHAAEQAGATIQRPAEDQPYGDRMCTLIDPFGVRWMIGTRVRDLSAEELEALARQYSGAQPGPVR